MNRDEIPALPSMPPANPSYPRGLYRFITWQYFIVAYESDPEAIGHPVPGPWNRMGPIGCCTNGPTCLTAPALGITRGERSRNPCTYIGQAVYHTAQMYLNVEPPITVGHEIWGFPKRDGQPKLEVIQDTLTGTLHYGARRWPRAR